MSKMISLHQSAFVLFTNTLIYRDKNTEEWNMPSQYCKNQPRVDDVPSILLAVDFYWNDKDNCNNQEETSKRCQHV